jgi:hypothetical protein
MGSSASRVAHEIRRERAQAPTTAPGNSREGARPPLGKAAVLCSPFPYLTRFRITQMGGGRGQARNRPGEYGNAFLLENRRANTAISVFNEIPYNPDGGFGRLRRSSYAALRA